MSATLTLGRLKKIVDKLLELHSPRRKVVVSIPTLDTGNGTWNVCDIHHADIELINICDGDGFRVDNKDGSERTQLVLLLKGRFNDE